MNTTLSAVLLEVKGHLWSSSQILAFVYLIVGMQVFVKMFQAASVIGGQRSFEVTIDVKV